MAMSSKINRWNMHQLGAYERLQYLRERRAQVAETQAKTAALANGFASIQINHAAAQGDLVSRMAMTRLNKTA